MAAFPCNALFSREETESLAKKASQSKIKLNTTKMSLNKIPVVSPVYPPSFGKKSFQHRMLPCGFPAASSAPIHSPKRAIPSAFVEQALGLPIIWVRGRHRWQVTDGQAAARIGAGLPRGRGDWLLRPHLPFLPASFRALRWRGKRRVQEVASDWRSPRRGGEAGAAWQRR